MKTKTIVFLHGMFQNPKSWDKWKRYFKEKGYECFSPAYPFHEGEPSMLRKNIDPTLSTLTFGQVVDSLEKFIGNLGQAPILVGHSMGGLAVQSLLGRKKGVAGVCIDPAPPKGIFSLQFSFLKANLPVVNPLKGNSVCLPSLSWFHYAFCNLMTMDQTRKEYDLYVVPESRNIARSTLGKDGSINFSQPHVPLLFIAGQKDHIVPPSLVKRTFDAYKDTGGRKDYKAFPLRTHYICGQDKWQEVADYILQWINNI